MNKNAIKVWIENALSENPNLPGTVGRPYFELKYTTLDGETHIGYSSYFLPNVFRWRDELFEIVK